MESKENKTIQTKGVNFEMLADILQFRRMKNKLKNFYKESKETWNYL